MGLNYDYDYSPRLWTFDPASLEWLDSDLIPRLLEIFEKLKFFDHFDKRQK